jgi:HSP20 family molecular chaperone IbpA
MPIILSSKAYRLRKLKGLSKQFCRELRLPAEVAPVQTTAVLKDGVLELVFAKAAESKPVAVEGKPE